MTLQAEPGGGIHLEYGLDRTEPRAEAGLFDLHARRSEEFVYVCSWCRRVRHAEAWQEVEQAIAEADLFGRGQLMPNVSHGICGDCVSTLKASMRGGRPAPESAIRDQDPHDEAIVVDLCRKRRVIPLGRPWKHGILPPFPGEAAPRE